MITKDNNLKVMELFFKSPYRSFHIREIARLTGLSSTGIIKIIKRLKKEKLLVSRKSNNLEEIKKRFKIGYHLKLGHIKGRIEKINLVEIKIRTQKGDVFLVPHAYTMKFYSR